MKLHQFCYSLWSSSEFSHDWKLKKLKSDIHPIIYMKNYPEICVQIDIWTDGRCAFFSDLTFTSQISRGGRILLGPPVSVFLYSSRGSTAAGGKPSTWVQRQSRDKTNRKLRERFPLQFVYVFALHSRRFAIHDRRCMRIWREPSTPERTMRVASPSYERTPFFWYTRLNWRHTNTYTQLLTWKLIQLYFQLIQESSDAGKSTNYKHKCAPKVLYICPFKRRSFDFTKSIYQWEKHFLDFSSQTFVPKGERNITFGALLCL